MQGASKAAVQGSARMVVQRCRRQGHDGADTDGDGDDDDDSVGNDDKCLTTMARR